MHESNNMYNVTKNTKIVVFASLIATIVLSLSGMSFAEAKVLNSLPDDRLLERDDGWKSKYATVDEFEKSKRSITTYVSDQHPDNKWNEQTKKNQIVIYNFDTKADARNAGLNALLAYVENQKSSGSYNPTGAEKRFHEWAFKQIPDPVMPDASLEHVKKVIKAYNSNANYGNVPTELIETDSEFWINMATLKSCDLENGCDMNELGIPFAAYAASSSHVLSSYVDAYACETGSCYYTDIDYGTGVLNTTQGGGGNHATVPLIYYYIYDVKRGTTQDTSHEVSGTVQAGSSTEDIGPKTGTNSVLLKGFEWFGYDGCGSSHCGVFSLSAQAEDVTY